MAGLKRRSGVAAADQDAEDQEQGCESDRGGRQTFAWGVLRRLAGGIHQTAGGRATGSIDSGELRRRPGGGRYQPKILCRSGDLRRRCLHRHHRVRSAARLAEKGHRDGKGEKEWFHMDRSLERIVWFNG